MAAIPVGNRVIGQKLGSSDATIRTRMENFPAIVSDAAALTSPQLATIRAASIANGHTNFKALAYVNMVDINVANVAMPTAVKQVICNTPNFILRQQGVNGLPLHPNISSATQMLMPAHARNIVDSTGRTYAEMYADLIWADNINAYNWDGVYYDEWLPHLRCSGTWGTTYAGTVTAGSTTTNIKTSGFTVTGSASWGRFKDDTLSTALQGVFFAANSSTATDVPLGVTLPAVPAIGDTFELLATVSATFSGGAGFTAYLADLFRDGAEHNEGSGRAATEVMYCQQLGVRRLKALATAAAKPNFLVTGNLGYGAGRYPYIRELVRDGMMHGFGMEPFIGKSASPTPRASLNIMNELVNLFGPASATSFPYCEGYASGATDYTAMRNAYSLAMMTDAWYGTNLSANCVVADEYLVPLSIAAQVDPPQNNRQSAGYYLRRYTNGAAIYNSSGSTISGITVAGYRKFNAANAPYTGQDTSFNDGASTFSLNALSGAILVAG